MANLTEALDEVLASVARGESLEGCLARYPNLAVELAQLIGMRDRLGALTPVPAIPADTLAARRRQFLSTARTYKQQTKSANVLQRLAASVWPVQRADRPALWPATFVARAAIAVVLVLSIMGGTAAAAQSSLPDSPLYTIKLAVEDVRLNLTRDPAQQATLFLSFASERASEMERLAIANHSIQSQVSLRLQNQLDAALSDAARAPEPEMLRLLNQVRLTAQTQEHALMQAQVNAPDEPGTQDALRQAEQAMAQAQREAEAGLADPGAFRSRYRREQNAPMQSTPEVTATPVPPTTTALPKPATIPEVTTTPQSSRTPQILVTPQASVTPQRNQTGTGQPSTRTPGPQVTVTPQQIGPGPQPTGQGGPGPQATGEPGGGSGSGENGGSGGSGGNNAGGTRRP